MNCTAHQDAILRIASPSRDWARMR